MGAVGPVIVELVERTGQARTALVTVLAGLFSSKPLLAQAFDSVDQFT